VEREKRMKRPAEKRSTFKKTQEGRNDSAAETEKRGEKFQARIGWVKKIGGAKSWSSFGGKGNRLKGGI